MTISELENVGNNWMNRAHNLRVIWQDESLPWVKRNKAFKLWNTMYRRVLNCQSALIAHQQKRNSKIAAKFTVGGVLCDIRGGGERMPKKQAK